MLSLLMVDAYRLPVLPFFLISRVPKLCRDNSTLSKQITVPSLPQQAVIKGLSSGQQDGNGRVVKIILKVRCAFLYPSLNHLLKMKAGMPT